MTFMKTASSNISFVHGVCAYSIFAIGPFLHSNASSLMALLLCTFAGWFRRAYLLSFIGGIIVSVIAWTAVGVIASSGTGVGVFFMVPFALVVILPIAIAAYFVGRFIFSITHRKVSGK